VNSFIAINLLLETRTISTFNKILWAPFTIRSSHRPYCSARGLLEIQQWKRNLRMSEIDKFITSVETIKKVFK